MNRTTYTFNKLVTSFRLAFSVLSLLNQFSKKKKSLKKRSSYSQLKKLFIKLISCSKLLVLNTIKLFYLVVSNFFKFNSKKISLISKRIWVIFIYLRDIKRTLLNLNNLVFSKIFRSTSLIWFSVMISFLAITLISSTFFKLFLISGLIFRVLNISIFFACLLCLLTLTIRIISRSLKLNIGKPMFYLLSLLSFILMLVFLVCLIYNIYHFYIELDNVIIFLQLKFSVLRTGIIKMASEYGFGSNATKGSTSNSGFSENSGGPWPSGGSGGSGGQGPSGGSGGQGPSGGSGGSGGRGPSGGSEGFEGPGPVTNPIQNTYSSGSQQQGNITRRPPARLFSNFSPISDPLVWAKDVYFRNRFLPRIAQWSMNYGYNPLFYTPVTVEERLTVEQGIINVARTLNQANSSLMRNQDAAFFTFETFRIRDLRQQGHQIPVQPIELISIDRFLTDCNTLREQGKMGGISVAIYNRAEALNQASSWMMAEIYARANQWPRS